MTNTPTSLLVRLQQPEEPEAWARLVELYTPLIYHWARRMGLSNHDASDLVQDVLTTLVRKLPEFSYDPSKSFRAWLRVVTLNAWRQALRKDLTQVHGAADGLSGVAAPDEGQDFEEVEYRHHLVARALDIMKAEFQPTTWRACWESIVEGRPASDVARDLGISTNAVYLAKSRVLRRLYQELDGLLN